MVGPVSAPAWAMRRQSGGVLGLVEAAGLPEGDAMQLLDCLSGYTIGKVLAETAESVAASGEVAQALGGLTPESHPHVVGALIAGYGADPDAQFDRGLTALLEGWR